MARVLVIDDAANVRLTIKAVLERKGHEVALAACGSRGITLSDIYAFDVVIVDIFMPGMNGLHTIQVLRRCQPEVKIVTVSGYAFRGSTGAAPDFLRMAVALGAASSLQKPFSAAELVAAVETEGFTVPCRRLTALADGTASLR